MEEPLFLKPVFQEKIWGGTKLEKTFGYTLPNDKIGECWAISAHPHGISEIEKGVYQGEKLSDLWKNQPKLFGQPKEPNFPLLTKILDAEADLSVQVHPNDQYALQHEGELGKTECWYIIEAEPGAEIIYGHHAKTKDELLEMIKSEKWDKLLRRIPVKKGEFYYVPSGTIHAIGKGIMVLETQQSSDTTYRVYDYDRLDQTGKKRELQVADSVAVTLIPHQDPTINIQQINQGESSVTTFVNSEFFSVYEWEVKGILRLVQQAPYTLASVLEGEGSLIIEDIDTNQEVVYPLIKGQHFILPNGIKKWRVEGLLQIIASEPGM